MTQRLNTRLESEGAEFLVLSQLLLHKIPSYKAYTRMPGYDLISVNPDNNKSARIQVKSRWQTGAKGFPVKNFDFDFLVAVFLNRGSKDGKKEKRLPEYFVLPASAIKNLPRSKDWGKVNLGLDIRQKYQEKWNLVKEFLN